VIRTLRQNSQGLSPSERLWIGRGVATAIASALGAGAPGVASSRGSPQFDSDVTSSLLELVSPLRWADAALDESVELKESLGGDVCQAD
jgi:hypothetical protein